MARWTIGLTGSVGSGKTTVRRWLGEQGAATLDADAVVHELLREPEVVAAVTDCFGSSVRDDGRIDRAALAEIVFADPTALADLEGLLHPRVVERTRRWLADVEANLDADVAVVEAIKLIEAGMHTLLDRVWLVVCAPEVCRERLRGRGWSAEEIERRMVAGPPLGPRLAAANTVIDNSGPWSATARQLASAWTRLVGARPPSAGR